MNLGEKTSLEELLSTMASRDKITKSLPDTLWDIFSSKRKHTTYQMKLNAVILLGMIGKAKKHVLADNLDTLTRVGLGELVTVNLLLTLG